MWADNFSKTHPNRSKLSQKIVIDGVVQSEKYSDYIIFISHYMFSTSEQLDQSNDWFLNTLCSTILYIFSHLIF